MSVIFYTTAINKIMFRIGDTCSYIVYASVTVLFSQSHCECITLCISLFVSHFHTLAQVLDEGNLRSEEYGIDSTLRLV